MTASTLRRNFGDLFTAEDAEGFLNDSAISALSAVNAGHHVTVFVIRRTSGGTPALV